MKSLVVKALPKKIQMQNTSFTVICIRLCTKIWDFNRKSNCISNYSIKQKMM